MFSCRHMGDIKGMDSNSANFHWRTTIVLIENPNVSMNKVLWGSHKKILRNCTCSCLKNIVHQFVWSGGDLMVWLMSSWWCWLLPGGKRYKLWRIWKTIEFGKTCRHFNSFWGKYGLCHHLCQSQKKFGGINKRNCRLWGTEWPFKIYEKCL